MKQENKDRAAQKKNERTRDKDRGERRPAARTGERRGTERKGERSEAAPRTYQSLAFVCFKESKKVYSFGYDGDDLKSGDRVVVETVRGQELGTIVKDCEPFLVQKNGLEIKPVLRKATPRDIEREKENVEKAKRALKICDECIREEDLSVHGL